MMHTQEAKPLVDIEFGSMSARTWSGSKIHTVITKDGRPGRRTLCGVTATLAIKDENVPVGLPKSKWCMSCGYPFKFRNPADLTDADRARMAKS